MVRRRITSVIAVAAVTAGLMVSGGIGTPASAGTGLFYQVVDADNDPYSGIYLRNSYNDFNDATRITSRYVLYGTTVELVCGQWGQAIGPYANRRWHKIYVPSGYAAGQTGWMPDRYMNTPNLANQYTPGEPECPASPTAGGSLYYAPEINNTSAGATIHRAYQSWRSDGDCPTNEADDFPHLYSPANRYITTLSGWSIGRLGPVYFLRETMVNNTKHRWKEIDYILIFDPGNWDQLMTGTCDKKYNPGWLYAEWLKYNPDARLVILAGEMTTPNAHKSIQEAYFNPIRNGNAPRDHVVTCNYGYKNHTQLFLDYRSWVNKPTITKTTCPDGVWGWNP